MPEIFRTSIKVRFDENDLQGVVHHVQVIKYFEIARIEFLGQLGLSYRQMLDEGLEFVIRKVSARYRKPLIFDELIKIEVQVEELARASFHLAYKIFNQAGELAVEGETEQLCARLGVGKPIALPEKYLQALKK